MSYYLVYRRHQSGTPDDYIEDVELTVYRIYIKRGDEYYDA